ncbi:MAG: hypothetical protein JXQ69_08095, partial [Paludibacteraceae bacterium]|nr:hypothetical protein [Paludibacteraceae bacterium]
VIDHATTYDGTANDIEAGQLKNNYEYDASGNLTKDVQEGISNIEWTVTGKVSKVTKTGDPDVLEILFAYDAMGNRISKTVVKQGSAATTVTTYYVRDASGNIMATYEKEGDDFSVAEQYIYGSQRLGYYYANKPLPACTSSEADVNGVLTGELTRGNKRYEITNHLGNVLAVVSDRKIPIYADATETSINAYKPNIINTTDYYPFGMAMKGRNAGGDNYRFGFGGQEKDEEIKGFGNHLSFGDYGYDPRTGRRCNVDPLSGKYPNISPYATFENNPIYFNDKTGQDAEVTISMGKDITISAKIYIYGAGASAAQAQKMQNAIMNDWNNSGNGWTYTDRATGEVYNVKFNVSVEVYDKKNPTNNPTFIPDSWNPISTNNYIEIGATQEDVSRSYVKGGDEGEWRGYGTDPSSHEFGHLIGLDDRYSDTNGTYLGWEGNVMGEPAGQGVVQQKNINNLVTPIINEYKESEQYEFNKGSTNIFWEYKSKIDESAPGWESSGTGTLDESTLP